MAGASSYSGLVDKTFWMILGSSVIMLLGITVTMIYFIVKYRRSRNPTPSDIEGSATLETLWTVLPTILVMVMFYYGWAGFKVMRDTPAGAMPVTVQARMWSWSFEYENGKQSTELYVPVGRPVARQAGVGRRDPQLLRARLPAEGGLRARPRRTTPGSRPSARASTTSSAPSTAATSTAPCSPRWWRCRPTASTCGSSRAAAGPRASTC